ncbi:MAG TPA: cyclic nucleotide-binding domain-containing protein [Myxococcales bacterium]|jgi:tetratricopeptide (TPR) repeat protein
MSDEPKGPHKPGQSDPADEAPEKVAAAPRATLRFGGEKKGPVPEGTVRFGMPLKEAPPAAPRPGPVPEGTVRFGMPLKDPPAAGRPVPEGTVRFGMPLKPAPPQPAKRPMPEGTVRFGMVADRPATQTLRFGERETDQAAALEKAGRFADAAAVWERSGELDHAIKAYEKAGQIDRAAHLLKLTGRSATAARLLESVGQHRKAAQIYEEIHELALAGSALVKAGDNDRAAALYEQAGAFEEAAALYAALGNLRKAEQLYERAGRTEEAAALRERASTTTHDSDELDVGAGSALLDEKRVVAVVASHLRKGDPDAAAHLYGACQKSIGYPVLSAIAGDDEAERCAAEMFVCACDFPMAAKVFENLGDLQSAAAMYERADEPLTAADVYLRLGDHAQAAALLQRGGHVREAGESWEACGELEKAAACYEKAEEPLLAGRLWSKAGKPARAVQSLQQVRQGDPGYDEAQQLLEQDLAKGGRKDLAGRGVVSLMDGFEFLKATPLFRDLSLDEMKAVYDSCETRTYSDGEVMVEQDQPGEALLVLRRGNATVVRVQGTAQEAVARLGPGSPVGEMALIDDSFTSARVIADGTVEAFVITRERFSRLMASSDRMALKLYRSVSHTLVRRLRATSRHLVGRGS